MKKPTVGLLLVAGLSTLFSIGVRYLMGTEGTGDVLFWLFTLAIISIILAFISEQNE